MLESQVMPEIKNIKDFAAEVDRDLPTFRGDLGGRRAEGCGFCVESVQTCILRQAQDAGL
jgi:hypothetical protein